MLRLEFHDAMNPFAKEIILKCLEKDPKKRINAKDLIKFFEKNLKKN